MYTEMSALSRPLVQNAALDRQYPAPQDTELIEGDEKLIDVIRDTFYTDFAQLRVGRNDVVDQEILGSLQNLCPGKYNNDVLLMVYFAARSAANLGGTGVPLYLFVDTYCERVKNTISEVSHARRRWLQTKEDIATLDNELSQIALQDPRYAEMVARPNVDPQSVITYLVESGGVGEVAAHLMFVKVDLRKIEEQFAGIFSGDASKKVSDGYAAAPVHIGSIVVHAECQGQEVYTAAADLKRDVSMPSKASAKLNELLTFESSPHDMNSEMIFTITVRPARTGGEHHLATLVSDFRANGTAEGNGIQMYPELPDGSVGLQMQVTWSPVKAKILLDRREREIKRLSEHVVDLNKAKNHLESITKPFPISVSTPQDKMARQLTNALKNVFKSTVPHQISMKISLILLLLSGIVCFSRPDFVNLLLAAVILYINISTNADSNAASGDIDAQLEAYSTNKGLFGMVGGNRWNPEIYQKVIIGCVFALVLDFLWMATFLTGWKAKDPEWALHFITKLATIASFALKILAIGFFWVCRRDFLQRQEAVEKAERVMNANINRI